MTAPRTIGLGLASRLCNSNLVFNLVSVAGSAVINRLALLVILAYLARVLGVENFGLIGYGVSVTAFASIPLSPGLLNWGTRAIARDRTCAGETLVAVNLIRLVLAFVAYAILAGFVFVGLASPRERFIVLSCGLTLFTMALSVDWVFGGLELTRISAALTAANSAVTILAMLVLVHSPKDVISYPLIVFGVTCVSVSAGYWILRRHLKLRLAWPRLPRIRHVLLDSIPLSVTVALVVVLHHANSLIVRGYLGTAALGIFLAAYRLFEHASGIPGVLQIVFMPRLARVAAKAPEAASREAALFARIHVVLGFLVASIVWAEAPAIVALFYGSAYEDAGVLLRIVAIAVVFNYAIIGYTNCLIMFGRDHVMLMVASVSAVVSVFGGLLLVPYLGVIGAALVVTCIDLAGWLASLPYYRVTIGPLQLRTWMRASVGAGATIGGSVLAQSFGFPVGIRVMVCLLVYVPFVLRELEEIFGGLMQTAVQLR